MNVVFEFLSADALDNVITSLHFAVDKVVYLGHADMLARKRDTTQRFLKKYCGVRQVDFLQLSKKNLQLVLKDVRTAILREREAGNAVFFDLTGGEELILVAFGMLAAELAAPMHRYDVVRDELHLLTPDGELRQITSLPRRRVRLTLDKFIEMQGGVINYRLHKPFKDLDSGRLTPDLNALWEVARRNADCWNTFSSQLGEQLAQQGLGIRQLNRAEQAPQVHGPAGADASAEAGTPQYEVTFTASKHRNFDALLDDLATVGLLRNFRHEDGVYRFKFKSESVRRLMQETGSLLELYTYQYARAKADDCKVGVHLDWDGVIQPRMNEDVLNEVDVLALQGNVPVFISCKAGGLSSTHALYALYELHTVADRFGGRHARKVLITGQALTPAGKERAENLGIELHVVDEEARETLVQ